MNIFQLPSGISFLAFAVLGVYVFLKNKRHPVNLFFALGMGFLALMEFGNFMTLVYFGSEAGLFWKRVSLAGACFIPLSWLAFSFCFGTKEPWRLVSQFKILFIGVGAISLFFAGFAFSGLFAAPTDSPAVLRLGGIGKAFYSFLLLAAVTIVAKLEHTIRQSAGDQRIKIRSLLLGVGGLFFFLIFSASESLLFSRIYLGLLPVGSSVFIICAAVIAFSVVRHKLMDVNFYMSRFVIYNSVTILVVGAYLLVVGLVTQLIRWFDLFPGYHLEILVLFLAILFLLGLFLSDRVRWKARMFINRHFYRSRYDYRKEWLKFSEGLSSILNVNDLVLPIGNMLKDTVGVKGVSLWVADTRAEKLTLAGPNSTGEKYEMKIAQEFLDELAEKKEPFPIEAPWARGFARENADIIKALQTSLAVPMVSGTELIGLILLGNKTTGEPFLGEDIDLLRSVGAQIGGAIVNARLSQELIGAKEMEMFHRLSSFVMHDLKNLVSSLTLLAQNAAEHMGNPQFQKDALDTVRASIYKMDALISRLSNNTVEITPNLEKVNLNEVVTEAVNRMGQAGRTSKAELQTDLGDIPGISADRDQIEKVVSNLLINAFEALEQGGRIAIKTETDADRVILSVSDNGPGMPPEFIEAELFKPFKSTKKKGLGVGLYQCKSIVEAHGGRIEVESQEGKGSTFRVILPVRRGA
jgi:putative PEP-CTERM system histidine kinase